MKINAALTLAQTKFGDHAFADIPKGGMPTVGVVVRDERIVFGAAITFEEAFIAAEKLAAARIQAGLLYAGLGMARIHNDRCQVGVRLYDEFVLLGSAGTFDRAFERANKTNAAIHADEIVEAVDAVQRRFGSNGRVGISDMGNCQVWRGSEMMSTHVTFNLAVKHAIDKDLAQLDMGARRNRPATASQEAAKPSQRKPFDKNRKPWHKATKPQVSYKAPVTTPRVGALELNTPANDPSMEDLVQHEAEMLSEQVEA